MGEAFMEKYGHFRGIKLTEAMPIMQRIAADKFDDWTWCRNMQCKYLDVLIDTRDGGWVHFKDRDGNLLSVADVEFQQGKSSLNATPEQQRNIDKYPDLPEPSVSGEPKADNNES